MKRHLYPMILVLLAMAAPVMLFRGCDEKDPAEVFFEEEELQISAYLEEHEEVYSTLIRVLEITDLKNTLNAYGHYTIFAPGNEAFDQFCEEKGKSSVDQFEGDYLATLVRYHLINSELESAYFRDGVMPDTTYSGDYLVITLSEGGLENIGVNDSKITQRDIHLENGILHRIDRVFEPITGSVAGKIGETGDFSIFNDALDLCGLSDTLDLVRIDLNEDIFIRTRFTLFAEPDEVFHQNGITGAGDLVERFSDTGNPAGKDDGFYRFMAYHIVPGRYYLNEIDSFNYPTMAPNMMISVNLEEEIRLNQHITVIESGSNIQARNGVLHRIGGMLEPYEPEPSFCIIDLTDYQGISLGQDYTERELEDIRGIRTENTGIYFRNSVLGDGETNLQTTSERVGWTVEFQLPTVTRGQYDVYLHWASYDYNTHLVQVIWDGLRLGEPISLIHNKRWPGVEWKYDYNTSQWVGRLRFTESVPHTLKFISLEPGYGNFDYVALWPVKEE